MYVFQRDTADNSIMFYKVDRMFPLGYQWTSELEFAYKYEYIEMEGSFLRLQDGKMKPRNCPDEIDGVFRKIRTEITVCCPDCDRSIYPSKRGLTCISCDKVLPTTP